jgi:hypothetical protein
MTLSRVSIRAFALVPLLPRRRDNGHSKLASFLRVSRCLGIAAGGGVMVRTEAALASLVSTARSYWVPRS